MQLIVDFLADLGDALSARNHRFSTASLWEETRPDVAGGRSLQNNLNDNYINTNFHYCYYNSTSEFRTTNEKRYRKKPYVILFIKWKWDLGKSVIQAQRDKGMHRPHLYKQWFLHFATEQDEMEEFFFMPISNFVIIYRDWTRLL